MKKNPVNHMMILDHIGLKNQKIWKDLDSVLINNSTSNPDLLIDES